MTGTSYKKPTPAETDHFSFRLEFTDEQGAHVHECSLSAADFDRAVREAWFQGFRDGSFESYAPQLAAARIEPLFGEQRDDARSNGFRVRLPTASGGDTSRDFSIGYFNARAATIRAELRAADKVSATSRLYFTLGAYLEDQTPPPGDAQLSFDPPTLCVPIRQLARSGYANADPWDGPTTTDLPVVISRSLIEDACDEARQHADREVGGFLLGHLCQDPGCGDVFLLVTCLVSAEGSTQATRTSVTFTPESFTRARELIELRSRPDLPPEIFVGWCHSHPFRFCAECPLPTPPECIQKVLFFSSDDIQLMESTFAQPFMVGLLAAVEPKLEAALGHSPVRLFGWRQGEVQARGFHVIDA